MSTILIATTNTFTAGAAVYTFEMWGAGGGGGGANWDHAVAGGYGGSGAHVSGTLNVTSGTQLQLRAGGGGRAGGSDQSSSVNNTCTGGNGGNASAIRIVSGNTLVAAAGGGGGGGGAGVRLDGYIGMGGMGGRDSNQSTRTAGVNRANANEGDGGSSGTNNESLAGEGGDYDGGNPPTKTLLLQDGGEGADPSSSGTGGHNANSDASGSPWGGVGGRAGDQFPSYIGKGPGGGGGGGYTGGGGGGSAGDQDRAGGGGGGGGSYHNPTYVSSVTTADGAGTQTTSGNAPTQTAGSSASAWPSSGTKPGQGGDGAVGTTTGAPSSQAEGGENGLVVLYRNGTEVARAGSSTQGSGQVQSYTIP